ncbi:cation channel sperm-associated auxiliary subunit beta-like [Hypanus sabinus]|uniref:cation channel sperm-associated auxiliary subunit beta-like n=1 Tax=Hypanus sabinus TaxID=79690 RepID=UPI0028C3F24B|nr:cation channel sperm-associated auxiliary subunit beta-like [Hypanus sabinus]
MQILSIVLSCLDLMPYDAGIYLLVTKSAFTSVHDKWFDVKPVICSLIKGDCNIWLLDIALTNRHLVLLTNRGLFISHSMLFQPGEDAQVWYSKDGGNSFDVLIKLKNEYVIKAVACPYSYTVIFITSANNIYYTKPGLSKYALFNYWDRRTMAFSCDHCGNIIRIFSNESTPTGLSVEFIDHKSLIAIDNAGFSRPLALQYVTRLKALFFEHISWIENDVDSEPMFSSAHVGKLLKLSSVGSAEITEVHKYRGSQHFLAVAIARIVVPYHAEPFYRRTLMNKLLIVKKGDMYHLELLDAEYGFIADDFEKTVVVPGYSSFLIVRVFSTNLVIAHGTMPEQTPDYFIVEERQWFMFDFGSKSGTWSIVENECVMSTEEQNNLIPNPILFLDINDSYQLTFDLSSIGFAGSKTFEVVIGNQVLLDTDSETYYDKTGRGVIIHYIRNKFNVRSGHWKLAAGRRDHLAAN